MTYLYIHVHQIPTHTVKNYAFIEESRYMYVFLTSEVEKQSSVIAAFCSRGGNEEATINLQFCLLS